MASVTGGRRFATMRARRFEQERERQTGQQRNCENVESFGVHHHDGLLADLHRQLAERLHLGVCDISPLCAAKCAALAAMRSCPSTGIGCEQFADRRCVKVVAPVDHGADDR